MRLRAKKAGLVERASTLYARIFTALHSPQKELEQLSLKMNRYVKSNEILYLNA